MMKMRYRRDGTPYPNDEAGLLEWAKDFENPRLKLVKQQTFWWGGWISTVWLGLNHQFGPGRPLIFETMVFAPRLTLRVIGIPGFKLLIPWLSHSFNDLDCARYSTEAEAVQGHKQLFWRWLIPSKLLTRTIENLAWRFRLENPIGASKLLRILHSFKQGSKEASTE